MDTSNHQTSAAQALSLSSFDDWLRTYADLHDLAINAAVAIQSEATSFAARRIHENVKLVHDLTCSIVCNDAVDVMADFARAAKMDYISEWSRMLTIESRLASQAACRIRQRADSTLSNMASRTVA